MSVKPKEKGTPMTCACCGIPRLIYMDSPSAQQVCDPCKQHSGRDLQQNLLLHRNWWLQYTAARERAHRSTVDTLRTDTSTEQARANEAESRVQELATVIDAAYANAPIGDLQQWVQSDLVKRSRSRERSAYRMRDEAMVVLWRLDQLHGDSKRGALCKCGEPIPKCPERKLLTPMIEILDLWEEQQLKRLRSGQIHGLPREHPEVLKKTGYSSWPYRR